MVKVYYKKRFYPFGESNYDQIQTLLYELNFEKYILMNHLCNNENIYKSEFNRKIDNKISLLNIEKDIINLIIEKEEIHKFTKINDIIEDGFIIVDDMVDVDLSLYKTISSIKTFLNNNDIKYYLVKDKNYNYV